MDKNEVELNSGRISVRVEGEEDTARLMQLASEQMEKQCRDWVMVDREVVSEQAESILQFKS